MKGSGKLLIFGGIVLATLGMLYGLHYALFVEHQTLVRMGGSLADAFTKAAMRSLPQAEIKLRGYADMKYNYVRQVDAHSHWIGLAMLMIVLGLMFDRVSFSERTRQRLAIVLLLGSILFPFGVLLQTNSRGGLLPSALAIAGSALVTLALAVIAVGFWRTSDAP